MAMDDPTTSLYRDPAVKAIVLAPSLAIAQEVVREYGCSIQCQLGSASLGIFVATTLAHAQTAAGALPANTPWCVAGNPTDDGAARQLRKTFGNETLMSLALGVTNTGKAWRNDTIMY